MPTYKDLQELIKTVIGWEDMLTGYYDCALDATGHPACRDLLNLLRERHLDHLAILREVNVNQFGADEWIQCAPDIDPVALLKMPALIGDVSPRVMVERILAFEQQVQDFYQCVAGLITSRDEQELFESLARTKERSLFEIKSCLEYSGGKL